MPAEIRSLSGAMLAENKKSLNRETLTGERLEYDDSSTVGVDEKESRRRFLSSLENYVESKASTNEKTYDRFVQFAAGTEKKQTRRKVNGRNQG